MTNQKKGFTLIETVLSIAIMGLVIVTVLGVFVRGGNALKKGRYKVAGVNLVEKKLSEVQNLFAKFPDPNINILDTEIRATISSTVNVPPSIMLWKDPPGSIGAPITIDGTENLVRTGDYDFLITIEDYIDSGANNLYNLRKVIVTVTWKDPLSGEARVLEVRTLVAKE